MNSVLDDIAFLANSENRVAVVEMLADEPRSRDELIGQVDASRVTIARILRELEAREWAARSGQEYTVTPLGEWACDEFLALVDEMSAANRLREPFQWIPSDLLPFDIRRLRDAEFVLLDGTDPTALVRRIIEFHRSGDRVRGVTRVAAPVLIENQWELTVQRDTRVELVLSPDAVDVIRNHPPTAEKFREMLAVENARYSVHEEIPISVGIVDDTVGINLTDEEGILKGGVVTDDETVHAWAVDFFETCQQNARPVDPQLITA